MDLSKLTPETPERCLHFCMHVRARLRPSLILWSEDRLAHRRRSPRSADAVCVRSPRLVLRRAHRVARCIIALHWLLHRERRA